MPLPCCSSSRSACCSIPAALIASPGLVVGALAVVLVGKPLVALLIVWAMRYPFRVALTVAIALAQIGEFSFILATIGRELGILTTVATNALVATVDRVDRAQSARVPGDRTGRALDCGAAAAVGAAESGAVDPVRPQGVRVRSAPRDPSHRAVVIGYGPTGRTVVRLLRENGIAPTVVELNMDTVRALRQDGIDAVYGDATRPETLEAAGVARAGSLILASAGMANSAEVIRAARALNPHVRVLARAPYLARCGVVEGGRRACRVLRRRRGRSRVHRGHSRDARGHARTDRQGTRARTS